MKKNQVNIRPGVSVLSVLRHLNYQPWYALAEFVDNAIQSYAEHYEDLRKAEPGATLKVDIILDYSASTITIRDNAAGISVEDYDRAFRAAVPPPNRKGLSEFGMGMKSAACWFAPQWEVRTSALSEEYEGYVTFDIAAIVRENLEDVEVRLSPAAKYTHFTEVTLRNVYKMPQGRTISKIKDHLASIYRVFLRSGAATIWVNGEELVFEEPEVLTAPHHRTLDGPSIRWQTDIDIRLDAQRRIYGTAALRAKGSTSRAGFALFRRGRVIQGSADEGYRPQYIFGAANSYTYQRLFGELHFEGFDVSHTKDGFRWDEYEESFLIELRKKLNDPALPLLDQAEGHRVRPSRPEVEKVAGEALKKMEAVVVGHLAEGLAEVPQSGKVETVPSELPSLATVTSRSFDVRIEHQTWRLIIDITNDTAMGPLFEIAEYNPQPPKNSSFDKLLRARLGVAHPFMLRFADASNTHLEPMVRLVLALCLAESQARSAGGGPGLVRHYMNALLRNPFARV